MSSLSQVRALNAGTHADFYLPAQHRNIYVTLSGKFSRESTVVFQGFCGPIPHYVNMRNLSSRNAVVTNAVVGPGHGEQVHLTQMTGAYDTMRIACTRLAMGDEILVEVSTSNTSHFDLGIVPVYAILVACTDVRNLESPRALFTPFKIDEEPDLAELVHSLQKRDDI
jgi:hypothetical protein